MRQSLDANLRMMLLSTVSQFDEATLQRELGRLVEAEIVYQRGCHHNRPTRLNMRLFRTQPMKHS